MGAPSRDVIEHAVPAHVPEAMGRVTHYVEYDYPSRRAGDVVTGERIPCCSESEALRLARANQKLKMRNIRISTAGSSS